MCIDGRKQKWLVLLFMTLIVTNNDHWFATALTNIYMYTRF